MVWLRVAADNAHFELAWALREGVGFGVPRSRVLNLPFSFGPQLAVGDVNGDGRADVVMSTNVEGTGRISVLHQVDGGGFGAPVGYASYFNAGELAVGDLDGDRRADVVVAHSTASTLGVYLQAPNGTLQAERRFEGSYHYVDYSQSLRHRRPPAAPRGSRVVRLSGHFNNFCRTPSASMSMSVPRPRCAISLHAITRY